MSRPGAQRIELRAIVAFAAVCALAFNLLGSGAAYGARGDRSLQATQSDAHWVLCHDREHGDLRHGVPARGGHAGHADCLQCCLATHAGGAVLPERSATLARRDRTAAPILYMAFAAQAPHFAAPSMVNGARAPPELTCAS